MHSQASLALKAAAGNAGIKARKQRSIGLMGVKGHQVKMRAICRKPRVSFTLLEREVGRERSKGKRWGNMRSEDNCSNLDLSLDFAVL